jgi:hypothetical protein
MNDGSRAALAFSPQERMERLQALDSFQMMFALTFLSGYAPAVFDAVIDIADQERADGVPETAEWHEALFRQTLLRKAPLGQGDSGRGNPLR